MKTINFLIKSTLVFLFILISNISQSQTKVDLFTGWSGSSDADHILWQPPFESGKGWYAAVYYSSEMTKGGTINGTNILNSLRWNLQYDLQGAGASRSFGNVNIYLYHMNISSFTNTSKPTLPMGAVKVFSGTIDFKIPASSQTVCEVHVPFSTNFVYDGTSSLVVYVEKTTPDYQITNPYFALLEDLDKLRIRNVGSYKGNNVSDYDNTKKYKYPQIKFNDNATPTCLGGIVTPPTPVLPPTGNSTQNFCSSSNPKISDIVVTGTDIKWYNQLIGGNPLSTSLGLSNGVYYATQTISGVESSRYPITINITNSSTPTTTSFVQNFCSSIKAQVKDLIVSSTSGSTINWYVLNGTTPLQSTDFLYNGKYYATSSISGCESLNKLEVTVNIIDQLAPTTSSSTQNFCSSTNDKVSDLSVIANVGYAINWYSTLNGTTPLLYSDLLSNGTYYATQYKLGCESSNRLSVTVNIINPLSPTTSSSTQSFCSSVNAKVSDLIASSSGSINWYSTNTSTLILPNNTTLVNGNLYYATSSIGTPSCESTSRLEIEVKIIQQSDPITNLQQSFCSSTNPKVSDLSASTSIGSIIWYLDNTTTTALNGNEILYDGKYFASSIISTCESSRIEIEVSINDPSISIATNSDQSFCSSMSPSITDLIAYSSTGTIIKWYSSISSSSELTITTKLVNGNTYYASAYNTTNLCESVNRFGVVVTIISPSKPTTTNKTQSFCISEKSKVSDLLATSTYGSSIKWYSNISTIIPLSNNEILVNGNTYYATEITTGSPSCESLDRLEISVEIHDLPLAPIGNVNQYFCKDSDPIVSNLSANGFSIKWYNTKDGDILYNGNDPLIDGNHYFSTQTISQGCEGDLRLEVIVHFSDIKLELKSKKTPFCNTYDGGLSVIASGGIGKYSYTWDNGMNTSIIQNIEDGSYRINIIDSVGCVFTEDFVLDCIKSKIPQVITPDGNDQNETWVLNLDTKIEVKIFNRWGSLVYTAMPYLNDWKGQNNQGSLIGNGLLPGGTYYYLIDMKDGSNVLSGFIELIR